MSWKFVLLVMESLVLLGAALAWKDSFFLPSQMIASGVSRGIPFIAHGAMWGDFFIISLLVAMIVHTFGYTWSGGEIILALFAGVVASMMMHLTYLATPFLEAHVQNGRLTLAGIAHIVYMALAFAVMILFFFYTNGVAIVDAQIVCVLIFLHVFLAPHIPLYLVGPSWYPGNPLKDLGTWSILGGSAAMLFWRYHAVIR